MSVLRPSKNRLTQGFNSSHKGFDFDDVPIKEYYASFDGVMQTVVNAFTTSWNAGNRPLTTQDYGNYLKLRGNNGLTQLGAHFPKDGIIVQQGKLVKRGDILGYAPGTNNDTGNSTGGHTHTEYRNSSGVSVDVIFDTNYPSVSETPAGSTMNYDELGRQCEILLKRYGKGSFVDFDAFLKEHVGEDGQGGYLRGARDENDRLKKAIELLSQQPQTTDLPTMYNGKEVLGVIIKP